jgi:hypothetical protein
MNPKEITKDKLKELLLDNSEVHLDLDEKQRQEFCVYKNNVYDTIIKMENLQKEMDQLLSSIPETENQDK